MRGLGLEPHFAHLEILRSHPPDHLAQDDFPAYCPLPTAYCLTVPYQRKETGNPRVTIASAPETTAGLPTSTP